MSDHLDTEDRVREALRHRAALVDPADRLTAILDAAHAEELEHPGGHSLSRPRWLVPLAAAAALLMIVGGVWLAERRPTAPLHSANPPTATPSLPVTSPTPTPPSPTPTSTAVPSTTSVALPVYVINDNAWPVSAATTRWALFREFHRVPLAQPTDAGSRALAAAGLALASETPLEPGGTLQVWQGVSARSVSVSATGITVTLGGSGNAALPAALKRLAVDQLVWTVQGAVGRGNLPVRLVMADGGSTVFGSVSVTSTFSRPAPLQYATVLGDIWVTAPEPGAVLPAGTVTVSGQACVFEAALQWELRRSGAVVATGSAMASIGAPERGTFSVPLGRLGAGDYVMTVWSTSMKDGSIAAARQVSFTVA